MQQAFLRQDPKLAPVPALRTVLPRKVTSTVLAQPAAPAAGAALVGPGGSRLPLRDDVVVLGRHEDCDPVPADDEVSRRHAQVVPTDQAELADLGSTNGTSVNQRKVVGAVQLADQDRIDLGDSTILFIASVAGDPGTEASEWLRT